jgi:hypothetical protein
MAHFNCEGREEGLPSVIYRKEEMFWNYIENIEVLTERLRC